MDGSSFLDPSAIKAQCDQAIQKLQQDSQSMEIVNNSLNHFIADGQLRSNAFSALKQQMSDYQTIIQAMKTANEADISDYQLLKGTVGGEVLDGANIMTQKQNAESALLQDTQMAEQYRNMMYSATEPTLHSYYYWKVNQYIQMAETDQQLVSEWQKKIDHYDEIESATTDLFSASEGLRAAIKSGLSNIGEAFQGGSYNIKLGQEWRNKIQDEINVLYLNQKTDFELEEDKTALMQKLDSDYAAGNIDRSTYETIKSNILNTGIAYIREMAMNKIQEVGADAIATTVTSWLRNNTTVFVNRGMVASLVTGGEVLVTETPTLLTQTIRSGAKYGIPIVGTAIDFAMQVSQGENAVDAGVKSVAHTGISMGAVKIGAVIGTAIPIPVLGTVVGAAVGFAVGVAANMAFDWIYDNKESIVNGVKETVSKVGDALEDVGEGISDFFGGIGNAIFG